MSKKIEFTDQELEAVFVLAGSYLTNVRNIGPAAVEEVVLSFSQILKIHPKDQEIFFTKFYEKMDEIGTKYPVIKEEDASATAEPEAKPSVEPLGKDLPLTTWGKDPSRGKKGN